jgi:hypothetical protein
MPLTQSRRGAALITSLITIVIVAGIALLMFNRTMSEMGHSRDNVAITQTMMLARGGANVGGAYLRGFDTLVQEVVETAGVTNQRWTFGGNNTEPQPDTASVVTAMKTLSTRLQSEVDRDVCNKNYAPVGSSATVSVRIYFVGTACGVGLPNKTNLPDGRFVSGEPRDTGDPNSLQIYAVPFVMVAEAKQGDYKRNIVLQGEYRFEVGRSSFARFAYFTNERKVPRSDGTVVPVTFGDEEIVDGPVHSNEYLRYKDKPWFGGPVTVAGCEDPSLTDCGSARKPGDFFNGNFHASDQACQSNESGNCPTFKGGVTWGADYIPLPTNNFQQKEVGLESGLAFTKTLKDLELSVLTQGGQTYQVIRAETCANNPDTSKPNDVTCTAPTVVTEYRFANNPVKDKGFPLEVKDASGNWSAYKKPDGTPYYFKGVIFSDGGIASLGGPARTNNADPATAAPAVADFAQFTVAATGRIVMTRDLKYTSSPCSGTAQWNGGNVTSAPCDNLTAKNILGVYSLKGDALFGTGDAATLPELTIQGIVMSGQGRVGTQNWDTVRNTKTNLNLTGGIIANVAAGFYTRDGGYLRNFTYDPRTGQGTVPPFFPSAGEDTAKVPIFFSYGQREQVY